MIATKAGAWVTFLSKPIFTVIGSADLKLPLLPEPEEPQPDSSVRNKTIARLE
ncbi:hypothetical protein GCM10010912_39690 [Paenibacillus albidus]|uniref:Uncharacterized protein n=1 Tax=Paenibacillus albidus TaxID=2041023 RepID=A0A917FMX5_9BACL|nr:hypothetical protein GCM10010912_39690 [Paenibacillus albidus]